MVSELVVSEICLGKSLRGFAPLFVCLLARVRIFLPVLFHVRCCDVRACVPASCFPCPSSRSRQGDCGLCKLIFPASVSCLPAKVFPALAADIFPIGLSFFSRYTVVPSFLQFAQWISKRFKTFLEPQMSILGFLIRYSGLSRFLA